MSIRNMDADVASNKLNELFHLHRYEDCVLFINRLSHITIKLVISQISIDMYLSRLPYTIEILEAIYAKIFIMDPDNFPIRTLQPERIIDKMVAYFSLLSDQNRMEPIDGAKMLDSFENVIRIISYVQPNLYSRLLYFKYAIDKGLLRLEKDVALYNTSLNLTLNNNNNNISNSQDNKTMSTSLILNSSSPNANNVGSLKKSATKSKTALANAILISRASNMQSCETLRNELSLTIQNCEKSLNKLNDFIAQLKSQKQFKEIQFYLNQQLKQHIKEFENDLNSNEVNENEDKSLKTSSTKTVQKRSESVKTNRNRDQSSENVNTDSGAIAAGTTTTMAVVCQDVIQNRLYLNKSMMNSVEPYLQTIKLEQLLNNLYEKIDLDKEILLVFTHLKREEKHLSSIEPLQPLFRRYSLGFERCIQIWRRKCSADSLLLFNDKFNSSSNNNNSNSKSKQYIQQLDKLYIVDNEESDQLDQLHSSYSSSALAIPTNGKKVSSSIAAAAVAASAAAASLSFNNHYHNLADCYLTTTQENINDECNLSRINNNTNSPPKNQKFFSEVNLYTNPPQCLYNTMPSRLRGVKISNNLVGNSFRDSTILNEESTNSDNGLKQLKTSPDNAHISNLSNNGVTHSDTFDSLSNLTDTKLSKQEYATLDTTRISFLKVKKDDLVVSQQQQELETLSKELALAKETISKLRKNENKLRERLHEMETSSDIILDYSIDSNNSNLNEYTSDLIHMYISLDKKYRQKAYESLDSIKEIQSMNEFKLKLLFSVVIVRIIYACKFYFCKIIFYFKF
jgi:hypothetical protein